MKIDMHCHISSGSIDSFVSLKKTVGLLKKKGFNGMLITDHNTYKAYNSYKKLILKHGISNNFSVLLGVEYDTIDAGHVIIVLPDNILMDKMFEKRGMTIHDVLDNVKRMGGVVGLAHPFAHGRFGASWYMNILTSKGVVENINKYYEKVLEDIDFIEGFNGTIPIKANELAKNLCNMYNKVCVAGSDSHRRSTVGLCGTLFNCEIVSNNDLIHAILNRKIKGVDEGYSKLAKSELFRKLFNICECIYYWIIKGKTKIVKCCYNYYVKPRRK